MERFKMGDVVTWESQSSGSTTRKVGKVVYIVKKGEVPFREASNKFPGHRKMFNGWRIPPGKADATRGYFVEVRDGKTDRAKPKLYMPYPDKLELAPADWEQ